MADLEGSLLPPKPASAINLRDSSYRLSASGRQPFQGVNVLGLKKRGQDLRSWIRVDSSGNSIPKLFVLIYLLVIYACLIPFLFTPQQSLVERRLWLET